MQLSPIYYVAILASLLTTLFYKKKKAAYSVALFLVFLGVMRGVEVGTDCLGYQIDYYIVKKITDAKYLYHKFEIGFVALIAFFKFFITPLYLPFVSCLFIIFFAGVKKFITLKNAPLGIALFIILAFSHYFYAYNIMRQMFALGLILLFLPFLYQQKYVKFLVSVVLICFLFHKSSILAVLLVPLHYYIVKKERKVPKKALYCAVILSFVFFFIADITLKKYFAAFAGLFYSRYEGYMLGAMGKQGLGYAYMGCQSLFALALIYWHKGNEKYNFEFVVYIVGVSLFNFFSSFSVVATRVAESFLIFNIVLFPLMMTDKTNRNLKYIRLAIIVTGLVLFFYNYGINNHGLVNPYYIESRFAE